MYVYVYTKSPYPIINRLVHTTQFKVKSRGEQTPGVRSSARLIFFGLVASHIFGVIGVEFDSCLLSETYDFEAAYTFLGNSKTALIRHSIFLTLIYLQQAGVNVHSPRTDE
jgi:hypothetical protein